MALKVITTVALLLGFGLLVLFPSVLMRRPAQTAPVAERRAFVRTLQYQLGGLLGCMVVSGTGAILIMRKVRREYAERTRENMQELIEGTLQDHRKKLPNA